MGAGEASSAGPANRVLIVDDEPGILKSLSRLLGRAGLETTLAQSAEEALEVLSGSEQPFKVVLSDFRMGGRDGVSLLSEVRERWPSVRRVMMSGFTDPQALERAINEAEVHRFLTKPWRPNRLIQELERAIEDHDLQQRVEALNRELEAKVEDRTRLLERAKREWLRTVDAIGDPVTLISQDYALERANIVLSRMTGLDKTAIAGRKCYETLVGGTEPCPGCPVAACLKSGDRAEGEIVDQKTGTVYVVSAYPVADRGDEVRGVVCTYRDVTDERQLQAQLLQSEKMAAVGTLAGGVAHEINNPLGGILMWTQLLLRETDEAEEQHGYLKEIEDSAMRCRSIVQSLLNFAREAPAERRDDVDVNQAIEKALFLVETTYVKKKNVRIKRELAPDLPFVRGNANQLQQVVLNLLTNAFGAIDDAGSIIVRSTAGAGVVVIEVVDDGVGIDSTAAKKVFQPFFTTKAQGEGTGLGLAVTYGIVEAHSGVIDFDSAVGEGTTFRVTLPIARTPSAELVTP